jgi:hypothetical protein
MRLRTFSLWTLAAASALAPAFAQGVSLGPEQLLSSEYFTSLYGPVPSLAVAADDSYLSAWRSSGSRIKLRGFNADDTPVGSSQSVLTGHSELDVQLAAIGADRYVAVWSPGEVRAQFLDGAGNALGETRKLAAQASDATVVGLTGGGFVVAWTDQTNGGYYNTRIAAQRFDGEGTPLGPVVVVSAHGGWPGVAALPGGGFAVAWWRPLSVYPYEYQVEAQVVGANDTLVGEPLVLAPASHTSYPKIRISTDAAGRAVVVWAEYSVNGDGPSRVLARRFSGDGQLIGDRIVVRETLDYSRAILVSDVASRPEGAFLVVWSEMAAVTGGPANIPYDMLPIAGDVYMRVFDASGEPRTAARLVHDQESGEQHEGEVEATRDGWLVTWRLRLDPASGIYARRVRLDCGTGAELCLGNRFRVTAHWQTRDGVSGDAQPLQLRGGSGSFWFFSPTNVELVVKVLDGRALNGSFWVFYGSLTDVEFDLEVRDAVTGAVRTYHNPGGRMASAADTEALPGSATGGTWAAAPPEANASVGTDGACSSDAACLRQRRYRATVDWRSPATGQSGHGVAAPLTGETGTFWFFNEGNVELIVKVLDGRALNGHDWVFYGSLTDVEFDLTVTDTQTGAQRSYHNPAGTLASRADTEAFSP